MDPGCKTNRSKLFHWLKTRLFQTMSKPVSEAALVPLVTTMTMTGCVSFTAHVSLVHRLSEHIGFWFPGGRQRTKAVFLS